MWGQPGSQRLRPRSWCRAEERAAHCVHVCPWGRKEVNWRERFYRKEHTQFFALSGHCWALIPSLTHLGLRQRTADSWVVICTLACGVVGIHMCTICQPTHMTGGLTVMKSKANQCHFLHNQHQWPAKRYITRTDLEKYSVIPANPFGFSTRKLASISAPRICKVLDSDSERYLHQLKVKLMSGSGLHMLKSTATKC